MEVREVRSTDQRQKRPGTDSPPSSLLTGSADPLLRIPRPAFGLLPGGDDLFILSRTGSHNRRRSVRGVLSTNNQPRPEALVLGRPPRGPEDFFSLDPKKMTVRS